MGKLLEPGEIVSGYSDFLTESNNISDRLRCRKYPSWTLIRAHNTTATKDRDLLLCSKEKCKDPLQKLLIFSTQFSMEYGTICKMIKKHMSLLTLDPTLNSVFVQGYRCVAHRAPTLGQMLSHSLFCTYAPKIPTWLNQKGVLSMWLQ